MKRTKAKRKNNDRPIAKNIQFKYSGDIFFRLDTELSQHGLRLNKKSLNISSNVDFYILQLDGNYDKSHHCAFVKRTKNNEKIINLSQKKFLQFKYSHEIF